MKNTINIKVFSKKEYNEFTQVLVKQGFNQIGTRLFEDDRSYVRITIEEG